MDNRARVIRVLKLQRDEKCRQGLLGIAVAYGVLSEQEGEELESIYGSQVAAIDLPADDPEANPDWIKCSEKLPNDGEPVLLVYPAPLWSCAMVGAGYLTEDKTWILLTDSWNDNSPPGQPYGDGSMEMDFKEIAFWQPLPELPGVNPDWIKCSEKLPDDGDAVLLVYPAPLLFCAMVGAGYCTENKMWIVLTDCWNDNNPPSRPYGEGSLRMGFKEIAFWQPFPELPDELLKNR